MTVFVGDRSLLDAFRHGDRAALAKVYYHYVDDIAAIVRHGFIVASTGARVRGARDEATERDLVQEVFARAFASRARDAYDGIRPYAPYLRRIARNLLVDRARATGQTIALDDDIDIAAEPDAGADNDPEWQAMAHETAAYVATLAPELRRLVALRFEDDRSQQDAATELGISRRRVRTLEARIVKGLRRWLRAAEKHRPGSSAVRTGT